MSHQDIAATVTIANGLIETVRRRERDFAAERVRWEAGRTEEQNRLEFLEARLVEYLAQLREDDGPPPEYESNHDGKAPHYMVPIGENLYVEARWVRQLPNGFVAGLPKECTPASTPYITELYAQPDDLDDDEPVLPLAPWIEELLAGPSARYGMLWDEVKKCNWGVQADVERYRGLEHQKCDVQRRIEHLQTEKRGIIAHQDAARDRLARAKLVYKVSALRVLGRDAIHVPYRGRRYRAAQRMQDEL
jgi:hypothetical protein